jgi:hypothetical protein
MFVGVRLMSVVASTWIFPRRRELGLGYRATAFGDAPSYALLRT